ncbi:uncharacterized protein LOC144646226 isoform X2 [Oculina patagonica]
MAMKLGVVLIILGLAKYTSCTVSSPRSIRAVVPGPDCYMSSQPECSLKPKSVGCYKSKPDQRALPELLLTAKDRKSAVYFGEKINWLEWANFIDRFTCACAVKAKQKNYDYFAIENYGECWSGMNANFSVYGLSGNCKMVKANECFFEACDEKRNDSRLCFGGPFAMYVYTIKEKEPPTMPPASTKPPTNAPSTMAPSTQPPTKPETPSVPPTTKPPTEGPSTLPPSTQPPTTKPETPIVPPTTKPPTEGPSTLPPSTQPPTTKPETPTVPPVTQPPTTAAPQPTPPPPAPTTAPPTSSEEDNCEE